MSHRGFSSPWALAAVLACPGASTAQAPGLPEESLYLYRSLPDVPIELLGAGTTSLSRLWSDKPLLLTLVFTRCTGICSPFLRSLRSAVSRVGGAGEDYRILVLSFDPRDRPEDMASVARELEVEDDADWLFGTGRPEDVRHLAASAGFWFRWDESSRQFDHPAMLVAVDRGRILRILVGGYVTPARLQEVVEELRGDFVPAYPLPGRVLFRCFQYDPSSRRMRLDWGFLLLLLPALTAIGGSLYTFRAARPAGASSTSYTDVDSQALKNQRDR